MIDLTDNDIDNILSSGKDMYTYFKDKYAESSKDDINYPTLYNDTVKFLNDNEKILSSISKDINKIINDILNTNNKKKIHRIINLLNDMMNEVDYFGKNMVILSKVQNYSYKRIYNSYLTDYTNLKKIYKKISDINNKKIRFTEKDLPTDINFTKISTTINSFIKVIDTIIDFLKIYLKL